MPNRVEELEATVAELQAAVDGLTEELVETRARLEDVEDALETAEARWERAVAANAGPSGADAEEPEGATTRAVEPAQGDVGVEAESVVDGEDERVGPATEAEAEADDEAAPDAEATHKTDTAADDTSGEDGDDGTEIIVA
jgi:uncharacterized coiled-coil protein SlyX